MHARELGKLMAMNYTLMYHTAGVARCLFVPLLSGTGSMPFTG
jgi:hypothetical protein